MSDHYLKFTDATAADDALAAAGFDGETGPGWAVDRIGSLTTEAVRDENHQIVTMPVPVAGHHVNLRLLDAALPTNLTACAIFPATPDRRFA